MSSGEFDLPDGVLAVIPTDPYEQLDLARKITSMAIASRVSNLESETGFLKQKINERDRTISQLQENVSRLQLQAQQAQSRLKLILDENMRLVQDKDLLSANIKKLNRDLGKLETFKRQLMQSLNEDTSAETVDIKTCDQSVPRSSSKRDDSSNCYPRHYTYDGSTELRYSSDESMKQTGQRFSLLPYQFTPKLTPTGTPKTISKRGSPKSYSAIGSPQKNSGATTPAKPLYDGRTSLSAWYPSSQQSSAANSPPRIRALSNRTPRVDGKEFFRQARSRLSYEQFSAFLANIKQLNDHKQSREETLKKAEEILGTPNKDLYLSFQGLLNRNVS